MNTLQTSGYQHPRHHGLTLGRPDAPPYAAVRRDSRIISLEVSPLAPQLARNRLPGRPACVMASARPSFLEQNRDPEPEEASSVRVTPPVRRLEGALLTGLRAGTE